MMGKEDTDITMPVLKIDGVPLEDGVEPAFGRGFINHGLELLQMFVDLLCSPEADRFGGVARVPVKRGSTDARPAGDGGHRQARDPMPVREFSRRPRDRRSDRVTMPFDAALP